VGLDNHRHRLPGLIVVAVGAVLARRRTERLQGRFGPEYDRAVQETGKRREAEGLLREREQRRSQMSIRPLTDAARRRYEQDWQLVQAHFVDSPVLAVTEADQLIQSVMRERGYPMEDFEGRAADLSVDHPHVVENYREGQRLSASASRGDAGTEELRHAMQCYRALFQELVVDRGDDEMADGGTEQTAMPDQQRRAG
jgi:hypothetical protein